MKIFDCIYEYRNEKNAEFQAKLTPTLSREVFLGAKVPQLRLIEKAYRGTKEAESFMLELPHKYYDENLLHSIMISNIKEYDKAMAEAEKFLPFIDNWAVCDTMKPKAFRKNKNCLIYKVKEWISSQDEYVCRFGIDMLMEYYLDDDFKPEYLELPLSVNLEEYYVKMMIAWYYATALAKRWEETIPYIEEKKLSKWVHNKTIQKACESFRITAEQKAYLRTLKISGKQ